MTKFLLCLALFIYFIFGFYHLPNFISADEHFWLPNSGYERIDDYWTAIEKGDWKDTRINDKPGITLAYTAGIAKLFDNAKGQLLKEDGTYKQFDPARTQQINFLYRLPILLLSGFFSFFFFWIIKKITGDEWIALFSATGILLSPVLLGISQIVNPDSLFWIFGFASLLSFYAFLQFQKKKFVGLASLFLGLGLASKYVSIIFIPFFLFMLLVYYFFEFETWREKREEFRKIMIRGCLAYLAVLAGGFLIFAVIMPASFVEPKVFYAGTIGFPGMQSVFWAAMALNLLIFLDALVFRSKSACYLLEKLQPLRQFLPKLVYFVLAGTVIFVIINWLVRNNIIDLSDIPFNAKRNDFFSGQPVYKRYLAEFGPLIFALTPLTLFSLLYAWLKGLLAEIKHETLVFILSAFFLVFYAAVIKEGLLVTVRYSIILFPITMLLAGIALDDFFSKQNWKEGKNKLFIQAFLAVVSIIFILFVFSYFQQLLPSGRIKKSFDYYSAKLYLSVPFVLFSLAVLTYLLYRFFPWSKIKNIRKTWVFTGFILISILNLGLIAPFYFSYTNELLPKKYVISGAWGYGGYEAAQYLNNLPNAKNLTVWADVYGVCEFFVGKCIHKPKVDVTKYKINYYFRSLQSSTPLNFPHPVEKSPVWIMHINNRPKSFLKIFKAAPADSNASGTDNSMDDDSLN